MPKDVVEGEKDEKVCISLKLDKDLYEKIKAQADIEYRSMNKQLIYLLHCGLEKNTLESKGE
jgi:hypothetical protein